MCYLPPATKLGQGYVFTGVCDSVHRGGVPDQVPPHLGTRYPPDQDTPPDQVPPQTPHWDQVHPTGTRYTPLGPGTPPRDQVHPPGTRYTPLGYTPLGPGTPPWDQVPPLGPGTPPGTRYTPPGPGTPPGTRYTPWDQVPPLGPGTPPRTRWGTRYTPQGDQVHPPGTRYTPLGPGTPPQGPGTPRTRYTPLGPPPWEGPGRYGLHAGGTHPNGMHSCSCKCHNAVMLPITNHSSLLPGNEVVGR